MKVMGGYDFPGSNSVSTRLFLRGKIFPLNNLGSNIFPSSEIKVNCLGRQVFGLTFSWYFCVSFFHKYA